MSWYDGCTLSADEFKQILWLLQTHPHQCEITKKLIERLKDWIYNRD